LKDGQQTTEEDIRAWAKDQMAAYKYPRIVEIRDALPMTATGKILKKDLKAESVGLAKGSYLDRTVPVSTEPPGICDTCCVRCEVCVAKVATV
jgi:hypothetical protein